MSFVPPVDDPVGQVRRLTEISRALTYAENLGEVLNLTVKHAAELLRSDKALLMLTNDDGLLSVRAALGIDREAAERFREPLNETLITRLEAILECADDRFLGVPLVVKGQVTGILAVTLDNGTENHEEKEFLLSALGDQAAVALEKARLDETAEFRERLIGIVSHDLRNPLSTILLGTSALLYREDLDAQVTKTIVRIRNSADRAQRMIRDLLDYTAARLGDGIQLNLALCELNSLLSHLEEETQVTHPDRLQIVCDGNAHGAWDNDRLLQLLGNLVANALQYSPKDTPITLRCTHDEDAVTISVHNQGTPIASEMLPRIFEPMKRATEQFTALRSVGLGLYIVRHIAEAHKGRVAVTSAVETGTTFTVSLPRNLAQVPLLREGEARQ